MEIQTEFLTGDLTLLQTPEEFRARSKESQLEILLRGLAEPLRFQLYLQLGERLPNTRLADVVVEYTKACRSRPERPPGLVVFFHQLRRGYEVATVEQPRSPSSVEHETLLAVSWLRYELHTFYHWTDSRERNIAEMAQLILLLVLDG